MKRKSPQHRLVPVRLNDKQIAMLDAEVERRRAETSEEIRVTRSSVMRHALMVELTKHAS